jgi:hypothetical protein
MARALLTKAVFYSFSKNVSRQYQNHDQAWSTVGVHFKTATMRFLHCKAYILPSHGNGEASVLGKLPYIVFKDDEMQTLIRNALRWFLQKCGCSITVIRLKYFSSGMDVKKPTHAFEKASNKI